MSILKYFVDKTFFASLMSFFVMLLGGTTLYNIHLQEFPDMEIPMTMVYTTVSGAAASDMEYGVTNKIEEELKSVSGIDEYFSSSKEGFSRIRIYINENEDLDKVNEDIKTAVDRVQGLLDDEIPTVEPFTLGRFAVMTFGLYSDTATEKELQQYARELEKKIRKISTISGVDVNGMREREFSIELNPEKTRAYKLNYNLISNKLAKTNIEASGGLLEKNGIEKRILMYSRMQNITDVENIIIKILDNGSIIKLKDIAVITDTYERKTSSAYVNNREGISFDIKKATSADIRNVISDITELLEKETEQFEGKFKYEIGMDLSKDMAERFNVVLSNGFMGLVFVILILSLSLRKQISFWVSISVPFCILGVVSLLPFFGISLDSITLAALLLVIGIIVDDSVVVAESISQFRQKGYSPKEASVLGVKSVFKPLIASLTTTCLVFIPMLTLSGSLGRMVYVIPVVVILSLLISLFDCIILLPAHINNIKEKNEKDNFIKIKVIYIKILKKVIKNKIKIILSSIIVTFAVLAAGTTLDLDFFPKDDSKYLKIRTIAPTGTSIEEIEAFNKSVIKMIKEKTGQDLKSIIFSNDQPKSSGFVELVNIKDRTILAAEYSKKYRKMDTGKFKISIRVDGGAGPPSGEPIEVRIISGNDQKRDSAVLDMINYLSTIEHVKDIEESNDIKDNQIRVIPDYEWLARYNYPVSDLSNLLRFIFDGKISTSIWIGDDEVDLRLSIEEKYKQIEYLKHTKIEMPNGEWVPIGKLVKIEEILVPSDITHLNAEKYTSVVADIETGDTSPTPTFIMKKLKDKFKDSIEVKYEFDGEAKDTAEAMSELIKVFVLSIIGMYFILALLLNSLIQPLLILIILPYAFSGAIGALIVHNASLSFFGVIGLLGMFGVVVNNSLILINRANELREEGFDKISAILNAAESRLRPIILTSLTTIFCLLPLVYGFGGKDEFMSPMAMTLGYGLLLTIPIVLFVIPCYYLLITKEKK